MALLPSPYWFCVNPLVAAEWMIIDSGIARICPLAASKLCSTKLATA
ncbi:hypothetical protein amrb99_13220 [Actinomadura sp. RB99]|nr:hypothetical protein [Actinomadura sp. RB99]MBD2892412.1 hypothetical protein [Actinomadura sp. RB99]